MKSPFKSRQWLSVGLSVVALLLCSLLYWEWGEGLKLQQELAQLRKIPVTPVSVQAILPEFVLPDADSGFPDMIPRSLFTAGRRSSGASSKGGRGAMKKGQFALVGVMVTPTQRSALLRDVQTNKIETVASGSSVRGMTLGDVGPGKVVLRQGGESEELLLNVQTGPKIASAVPGTSTTPVAVAAIPAKAPMPTTSMPVGSASAQPPAGSPKPLDASSASRATSVPPPVTHGNYQK